MCFALVLYTSLVANFEDRGKGTGTQTENCAKEEEGEHERKQSLSEESPIQEKNHVAVDEPPEYFQHLKLTPIEGSDDSLRIAVTFNDLEGLERLWEDYRSGHLNAIAAEYLVTDDIKERFHVESVNLTTTIQEEDYLACKEFFSSKLRKLKISFVIEDMRPVG